MIPGEIVSRAGEIELNKGRTTAKVKVAADRPAHLDLTFTL